MYIVRLKFPLISTRDLLGLHLERQPEHRELKWRLESKVRLNYLPLKPLLQFQPIFAQNIFE